MLGSFYKGGFDRGEKATHFVDSEKRVEQPLDVRRNLLHATGV
jgi:hypothetical protein